MERDGENKSISISIPIIILIFVRSGNDEMEIFIEGGSRATEDCKARISFCNNIPAIRLDQWAGTRVNASEET